MNNLRTTLIEKDIIISLCIYDVKDYANAWEVKSIIENPDIFEDLYSKYPLNTIDDTEDFFLYLLSLKIASMMDIVPLLANEEYKGKITTLSKEAKEVTQRIKIGDIISFINQNIEELFECETSLSSMRSALIDLIGQYMTGIKDTVIEYLCQKQFCLVIDNYGRFEKRLEKNCALYELLFPTGAFQEIELRFENVLDIWNHVLQKKGSNLAKITTKRVWVLYEQMKTMADGVNIDDILRKEWYIRGFDSFLKAIQSPLANDFLPYAEKTQQLLDKYIHEKGEKIKFEIPVGKILDLIKTEKNQLLRLLCITHDRRVDKKRIIEKSRLDTHDDSKSIIDKLGGNTNRDDYFTSSHQQKLSVMAAIGTATVMGILQNNEMLLDYLQIMISAVIYLDEVVGNHNENLRDDIDFLSRIIQYLANNAHASKEILAVFSYEVASFSCAMAEKIMRITYRYLIKDELYISVENITIGDLLNVSNAVMCKMFGENHIKNLLYFLQQTGDKKIGHNYRNKLAHWSKISTDQLTFDFAAEMLWLFTDILNTVVSYFAFIEEEGS